MTYRVLIIEDEATLARNIEKYLEKHGFEVQTAATGESGLALLSTFDPDVAVIDYRLTGIDGVETLARCRHAKPDLKTVMMTAHSNDQLETQARRAGAIAFLTKPIVLRDLKGIIDHAVSDVGTQVIHAHGTSQESAVASAVESDDPAHGLPWRGAEDVVPRTVEARLAASGSPRGRSRFAWPLAASLVSLAIGWGVGYLTSRPVDEAAGTVPVAATVQSAKAEQIEIAENLTDY